MMVTSGVLVILFCGFVAAKPSPQFLPVAVQLDQPSYQVRHTLKTSVKVTDKDSESLSNRSVPYKLKATVKVRDDKENDIASEGHSDFVVSSNDLLIPDTSSTAKSITESTKSLVESTSVSNKGLKKPIRSEPKDSKKFIFSRNSLWHLRTINDKPAEEVLVTDKASIARDLKDSTESALIKVKKLDEKD